jgi:hypothetical protein
MGRYSILQMGKKSPFMPSADTDTPPPALFAQLLSPVGFDTLLGQYSSVAATG